MFNKNILKHILDLNYIKVHNNSTNTYFIVHTITQQKLYLHEYRYTSVLQKKNKKTLKST